MYRLAHISDIHLPPLPRPHIKDLLGKRLLGWLSWQKRRRHIHRSEVLEQLSADLLQQAPDQIAVTGDLVNISLPAEFRMAADWLNALGPPAQVSVVPGNHDAYVRVPESQGLEAWKAYMSGDDSQAEPAFPYLRRRGPLSLIGLTTALPTAPGLASGALGEQQCAALECLLQETRQSVRVVLLHHSPLPDVSKPRKALRDGERLRAVLKRQGAELILHGHEHRLISGQLEGPDRPIPVRGTASASALPHAHKPGALYQLYGFEQLDDKRWQITIETRGYSLDKGRFIAVSDAPAILDPAHA
ncbi:metallophosphoesterase family protein [Fodinicurvata sediminis]|uniref:metallophosphoesterase family protein n=1 Tax=Fodinicurvata sediminis TaxID=1121832 RepID=UPI0003B62BB2|nr:metallophosphoesterase [Fodinicurvata sediminis]